MPRTYQPITVPLDPLQHDLCVELAYQRRISLNAYVRRALDAQIRSDTATGDPPAGLRTLLEAYLAGKVTP